MVVFRRHWQTYDGERSNQGAVKTGSSLALPPYSLPHAPRYHCRRVTLSSLCHYLVLYKSNFWTRPLLAIWERSQAHPSTPHPLLVHMFSLIANLPSQVSEFIQQFSSPRPPSEGPCSPLSILECSNILRSISDDSELVFELCKMATSKDPSSCADLAIPVDYAILDKLYGVRLVTMFFFSIFT